MIFRLFQIGSLMMLLYPHGALASAAEACADLSTRLLDCEPYHCRYERPLTSEGPETAVAEYAVLGEDESGQCGYRVRVDNQEIFHCTLSHDSRETMVRIVEMQLDGSYEENRQKLMAAVKDMSAGKTGGDPFAGIDPDFMALNNEFLSVLGTDCAN